MQIIIGIILLLGGIIGIIVSYVDYKSDIEYTIREVVGEIKIIQDKSFETNEMEFLETASLVEKFERTHNQIVNLTAILISSFSLIIIISLLFITQGWLNKLKR